MYCCTSLQVRAIRSNACDSLIGRRNLLSANTSELGGACSVGTAMRNEDYDNFAKVRLLCMFKRRGDMPLSQPLNQLDCAS